MSVADRDLFDPPAPTGVPPEVLALFDKFADDLWRTGWRHYSSDAILHRIRWHMHVEKRNREFKCNNNWTAALARWWLARHPQRPKFFELREHRAVGVEGAT